MGILEHFDKIHLSKTKVLTKTFKTLPVWPILTSLTLPSTALPFASSAAAILVSLLVLNIHPSYPRSFALAVPGIPFPSFLLLLIRLCSPITSERSTQTSYLKL